MLVSEFVTDYYCRGPPDVIRSFEVSRLDAVDPNPNETWPITYIAPYNLCGLMVVPPTEGCCTSMDLGPSNTFEIYGVNSAFAIPTEYNNPLGKSLKVANGETFCRLAHQQVTWIRSSDTCVAHLRCLKNGTLLVYDPSVDGCTHLVETWNLQQPIVFESQILGRQSGSMETIRDGTSHVGYTQVYFYYMSFKYPIEITSLLCYVVGYLLCVLMLGLVIRKTLSSRRLFYSVVQIVIVVGLILLLTFKLVYYMLPYPDINDFDGFKFFATMGGLSYAMEGLIPLAATEITLNYMVVPLLHRNPRFKTMLFNGLLLMVHFGLCLYPYLRMYGLYWLTSPDPTADERVAQVNYISNVVGPLANYWRLFMVFWDCGVPVWVAFKLVDPLRQMSLLKKMAALWKEDIIMVCLIVAQTVSFSFYYSLKMIGDYTSWFGSDTNYYSIHGYFYLILVQHICLNFVLVDRLQRLSMGSQKSDPISLSQPRTMDDSHKTSHKQ